MAEALWHAQVFSGPSAFRDRLGLSPWRTDWRPGGNRNRTGLWPWLHIREAWSGCNLVGGLAAGHASGHNGNQAYGREGHRWRYQFRFQTDPGRFDSPLNLQDSASGATAGTIATFITITQGRGLVIEKAKCPRCWTIDVEEAAQLAVLVG